MINFEEVLFNLVKPMVDNQNALSVKQMESLNENEILLYVYCDSNDTARLIGKQGSMASAIRQMMAIGSRSEHKKITIKIESY